VTGASTRPAEFVVIGAMKCGTTSLFDWFSRHPDCLMPDRKEPDFFSRDEMWARGVGWYRSLFPQRPATVLSGEASTSYTDPRYADRVADRMASLLPDVRIIFLVRDPIDRLRSHYLHEVQRGRERRAFVRAILDDERYVARSEYFRCFRPFTDAFPRERMLVVPFHELARGRGRDAIVRHLGLSRNGGPIGWHNETASKRAFTRPMLRLWEEGLLEGIAASVPRSLKRVARSMLTTSPTQGPRKHLIDSANADVPAWIVDRIVEDVSRFEEWVGMPVLSDANV
jgi:Sulfotransferase family